MLTRTVRCRMLDASLTAQPQQSSDQAPQAAYIPEHDIRLRTPQSGEVFAFLDDPEVYLARGRGNCSDHVYRATPLRDESEGWQVDNRYHTIEVRSLVWRD